MPLKSLHQVATVTLPLISTVFLTLGCGGSDTYKGPSRDEIKSIVRSELAEAPGVGEPALSREEVEQIVESAIAGIPEPALTRAGVEQVVQAGIVGIPTPAPGLSRDDIKEMLEQAVEKRIRLEQLTPEDVGKIIDARLAVSGPGLTRADIEEAVEATLQQIEESQATLTHAQVQQIARMVVASIPPKSAPAEYTQFVVNNAISRYETEGLDATLAYYNRAQSVDGQWYVFIIDGNGEIIGHFDADRIGLDLNGWVGTDANGYNFGADMLAATEDGKWVSYVYNNPEVDSPNTESVHHYQLKRAWVVRHDGLLFGSGWYIDADDYTQALVATTVSKFRSVGLEATVEYFTSAESVPAGLAATIDYYNNTGGVKGEWFAFIADGDGTIVAHYEPEMLGRNLEELFGTHVSEATEDGSWITSENYNPSTGQSSSLRVWVVRHEGMTFGSGWRNDGANQGFPDR